ncbi:MAG: homoserine dehydrogenase [SAR202 cluster bacterium]|nr:homoserine dehydrogenase [Chloroflexota bacterium]MQG50960.1 homoserine dehydrogenase [SAR202 cluster bacterium]
METQNINVGLLGLGTVGTEVAYQLLHNKNVINNPKSNVQINLSKVLINDITKQRPNYLSPDIITNNPDDIFNDKNINLIVELIGGDHIALEMINKAIDKKINIVTANKLVMSKYGHELLSQSKNNGVLLLYEASVGAGIPIIGPLYHSLIANNITRINAIINGTTNYILSNMSSRTQTFEDALKQAQHLGYAESDPTSDIEGIDATYKLSILASIVLNNKITEKNIYREGITKLSAVDFKYAKDLGYTIKLLAIGELNRDNVSLRVHPCLISNDHLLAKVEGVYNAIEIQGDPIGNIIFHGEGAGPKSTSSAILGDIISIANNISNNNVNSTENTRDYTINYVDYSYTSSSYYMRMSVLDKPGVLAEISSILGKYNISIASVLQTTHNQSDNIAELVMITHPAVVNNLNTAITNIKKSSQIKSIDSLVRIEDLN